MSTKTVHMVPVDTASYGPAGDGTVIYWFKKIDNAVRFARENTCCGKPATVQTSEVPSKIAARWSYAD